MKMQAELLKKLRYKDGKGLVLNAPSSFAHDFYKEYNPEDKFDFVLLFVNHSQEVRDFVPAAVPALNENALLWLAYPKQSGKIKTDINRDIIWKIVEENSDYRLVSNVAIDDTWSALRLRHKDKTTKK